MQNLINEIPKNQQFPDDHTFQWSEDLFNKIKQSEVFDSLPLSDLLILTKYATIVSIKKNCTLFKEGSYVPNLYVILDGNIDIIINDRVINTIGGYESLGEISFVDGHPVSADAITKTNCTLLIISKTKFLNKGGMKKSVVECSDQKNQHIYIYQYVTTYLPKVGLTPNTDLTEHIYQQPFI